MKRKGPLELSSLIDDPDYAQVKKEMQAHLAEWIAYAPDTGKRQYLSNRRNDPKHKNET